jgi:hypothetical protein
MLSGSGGAAAGGGNSGSGGFAPATGGGSGGLSTGGSSAGGSGAGGAPATGGASTGGSTGATGGTVGAGTGGSPEPGASIGNCTLNVGQQEGEGNTMEQFLEVDVTRDGQNYMLMTNGWGQNWVSHDISWLGSSFWIDSYEGSRQSNGAPAGYPAVFCGRYSVTSMACGLPAERSSINELNTAVKWSHPDGNGTYNVAYDVWMGDQDATGRLGLQSYFMVWLHDPAGEGPAGSLNTSGVSVEGAPGVWNIVDGTVNNLPIVNYVRAEGDDTHEIAFDILDFVRDAEARNLNFPGDDVLAVAIGFEIWEGPVTNLKLDDFCLDIQ